MNFFKKIIQFIGLSSIPLLVIYPINLYLLNSGLLISEQSGFYPSLAIFSLALEFGISSFVVSSRLSAKYFIKSISSLSFLLLFLSFATSIFLSTCYLFNYTFSDVWSLYILYLIYAYFGLCVSVSRAVYDRSKNLSQGLRVRYINQFSTSIALMLSLLGINDYIVISFVSLCRLPYFFVIKHLINKYKNLSNLNKINMSFSLIKSMIIVSLLTFLTDYFFRFYLSMSFSLESITFFAYAADIVIKVSGFLTGAIQPFYFTVVKYVSNKGFLLVLPAVFLPIFGSSFISISGVVVINFIQAIMLQKLIYNNQLFLRQFFLVYQLALLIGISSLLVKINVDLSIIDFWLIGQIICTVTLYLWDKNN